jgi:hypothetical protein
MARRPRGADAIVINPLRWWAFDEVWVYKLGDKRDFGGCRANGVYYVGVAASYPSAG